nr:hypothetical protein [uncultured Nocardioides sp.]
MPEVVTRHYDLDRTTLRLLAALSLGATASDAAVVCNVSDSTMRRKLAAVRDEWGVATNVQAVVFAVRRGLV